MERKKQTFRKKTAQSVDREKTQEKDALAIGRKLFVRVGGRGVKNKWTKMVPS